MPPILQWAFVACTLPLAISLVGFVLRLVMCRVLVFSGILLGLATVYILVALNKHQSMRLLPEAVGEGAPYAFAVVAVIALAISVAMIYLECQEAKLKGSRPKPFTEREKPDILDRVIYWILVALTIFLFLMSVKVIFLGKWAPS